MGTGSGAGSTSARLAGMVGVAQHLRGGAVLDDPAVVEDRGPVGDARGGGEVVGDEKHGNAELAPQPGQQVRAGDGLQRAGDLVAHRQRRAGRERPREGNAGTVRRDARGEPVFALPGQRFGPELDFHPSFDLPGVYRLWGQFRLADSHVITAPITVTAS